MTQTSKVLIPGDLWSTVYATSGNGIPLPNGAYRPDPNNVHVIAFNDTGKPANYDPASNRHTIAMDIAFSNGYLDNCHMGLIARHTGLKYVNVGDNASAAVIAGNWSLGGGSVAIEEIQITDTGGNGTSHEAGTPDSTLAVGLLQHNRVYRFALDSIVHNGVIGHVLRIWDKALNQGIYWSVHWSNYPHNYIGRDAGKVMLFSIHDPNLPNAGFRVSNLVSYWTPGNQDVPNP